MKCRFLREADELLSNLSVCFHHNITVFFCVIRVHDRNNFILLVTMFGRTPTYHSSRSERWCSIGSPRQKLWTVPL